MPVVPRAPDSGLQITSPKVATKTVIGMVLGVLCLFTIIISYQFLSCSWKKQRVRRVPHNGSLAIQATHPPLKTTHSFCFPLRRLPWLSSHEKGASEASEKGVSAGSRDRTRSLRVLLLSFTRGSIPSPGPTEPSNIHISSQNTYPKVRKRRALRSLNLNINNSRKPYLSTQSSSRKRFGQLFSTTPPDTPTPLPPYLSLASPFGRRNYMELDDSMYLITDRMERPPEAILSPWSPNEHEYPYPPYSPLNIKSLYEDVPGTPPPLYPPPPAYIPEVPARALGSTPTTPTRTMRASYSSVSTLVPPVSPIVSVLSEAIHEEMDNWGAASDIRAAIARTVSTGRDDAFVISNASDDDDDSSELDTVSICTDESLNPLR